MNAFLQTSTLQSKCSVINKRLLAEKYDLSFLLIDVGGTALYMTSDENPQ
jgi:hypothetical protein